jgi:two-component system nitrogen regulation response regulator NtrX
MREEREHEDTLKGFESMKLAEAKDEFERELLIRKLEEHGGNITRTSNSLGITPSHLHNKLKKYGIDAKGLR